MNRRVVNGSDMKTVVLGVIYALISVIVVAVLARLFIPYLSTIAMVDYVTFTGISALGIACLCYDGADPANQDMMSLITQRALVSREDDMKEQQNRISFSLSLGVCGFLLLAVSGVIAWLS